MLFFPFLYIQIWIFCICSDKYTAFPYLKNTILKISDGAAVSLASERTRRWATTLTTERVSDNRTHPGAKPWRWVSNRRASQYLASDSGFRLQIIRMRSVWFQIQNIFFRLDHWNLSCRSFRWWKIWFRTHLSPSDNPDSNAIPSRRRYSAWTATSPVGTWPP